MSASQSVWAALALCTISAGNVAGGQEQATYAERLGWPRGTRVVIFHVDDAGMSYDSNRATIKALEAGRRHLDERHDAVPVGAAVRGLGAGAIRRRTPAST